MSLSTRLSLEATSRFEFDEPVRITRVKGYQQSEEVLMTLLVIDWKWDEAASTWVATWATVTFHRIRTNGTPFVVAQSDTVYGNLIATRFPERIVDAVRNLPTLTIGVPA